ncbi:MAG: CoA pyrophosphatase [bacterium]
MVVRNTSVPRGEVLQTTVPADLALVRSYFQQQNRALRELRNPHLEDPVSTSVKEDARESAVLIPLIADEHPRVLVTKRQVHIRFAGHLCFPGGTSDPGDISMIDTALRESSEEIKIDPADIEVLGCLGNYYTQAGYRITPVVGVIQHPTKVEANLDEVESIHEISLARMFDSTSYKLTRHGGNRGHFSYTEDGIRITGPTVSIMIGLLESLASFHAIEGWRDRQD